jgi:hypothetical protein
LERRRRGTRHGKVDDEDDDADDDDDDGCGDNWGSDANDDDGLMEDADVSPCG